MCRHLSTFLEKASACRYYPWTTTLSWTLFILRLTWCSTQYSLVSSFLRHISNWSLVFNYCLFLFLFFSSHKLYIFRQSLLFLNLLAIFKFLKFQLISKIFFQLFLFLFLLQHFSWLCAAIGRQLHCEWQGKCVWKLESLLWLLHSLRPNRWWRRSVLKLLH